MQKRWFYVLSFSVLLSCNDDDAVGHVTDASLNKCYKIESKHTTSLESDDAIDLFEQLNGNYAFGSIDPNQVISIDEGTDILWKSQASQIEPLTVVVAQVIQNSVGEILVVANKYPEYSLVEKFSSDGQLIWSSKLESADYTQYNSIVPSISGSGYKLAGYQIVGPNVKRPIVRELDENGMAHDALTIAYENSAFERIVQLEDKYLLIGAYDASNDATNHGFYYLTLTEDGATTGIDIFSQTYPFYVKSTNTADKGAISASAIDLSTSSSQLNIDIQITRFDAQAAIQWTKEYGGDLVELPAAVIESSDGGLLILGSTTSYGFGKYDVLLVKTDGAGNVLWQNTYGTSKRDFAGSLVELDNGDLLMVGSTGENPKLFMMRLDENGKPK